MEPEHWLVAVLVGALLLAVVGWWRAHTRTRRANRRRQRHAQRGEHDAEDLLEEYGYDVVDRQQQRTWTLWIDGEPRDVRSRIDLLVMRAGRRYVAEVKTGARAPDPTLPATRRQLMEYRWVFPVDGVLLVDIDAGCIHEVHWRDPATG